MASPLLLPGRKRPALARIVDLQQLSKPQRAYLILAATALVVALVLLVWLLLWIVRARTGVEGWWIAQRGLVAPVLGFQADDLRPIVGPTGSPPPDVSVSDRTFEEALRARLTRAGRRPVVVYLSAVGVADEQAAFLLRPEPASLHAFSAEAGRQWLVTPQRLIEPFAESRSPKKLLILDAGQVGSDRNLGLFANGFLARLAAYLQANPVRGLAVLSSCAPGQTSWVSEADRCSVFGYHVAQGLSGAASGWDPNGHGLTVQGLARYVRHHVARWVSANRQAEQTPVLLGDPTVNFLLPRTIPARAGIGITPRDAKAADRLLARLDEAWTRRASLQAQHPYRHTPVQWRRYLETLLRCERLIRMGDDGEAEELLGQLPALEKTIADAAPGLPFAHPWSLALLERDLAFHPNPSAPRRAQAASARSKLDDALKELTLGEEDAQPLDEEPASEPTSVPGNPTPAPATPPNPAAKPPEPPAARPVLSQKPKNAAPSAKARKAGKREASALVALVDPIDKNHPSYIEAQLLVWADAFVERSGAPYAFKGVRGELLDEALGVRRLAEQAAASDERISRWIVPLVDTGDDLRRRVQDALFAGSPLSIESLRRLLDEARTRDRQAIDAAGRCARALDLIEQVEAELPYYGEWKARQPGRHDEGLDADFLALLAASTRLARVVQAGVGKEDRAPDGALAAVKDLEAAYRAVKEVWDRLTAEFQATAARLAAAGDAGHWREIDSLLCVPLVPVDVRRTLLRRIRSVTVAGTLSASASEEGQGHTTARPGEPQGDPRPATDPDFWNHALALARLDRGLLELGGAPEPDLARLDSAFAAARQAVQGDPAAAFRDFERLSALLRALRAERFQAIRRTEAAEYVPLAAADRAIRALPLAETLGTPDKTTETLDRYQRQALLLWHGRRLLGDFAPEHALRLFDDARQVLDTEAVRLAEDEAAAMRRAQIGVVPGSAGGLVVSEWTEQPLQVDVTTVGTLPPGDSVVLLGYDPAQPLAINSVATHQSAREGVLIAVAPDQTSRSVEYRVQRTESSHERATVPLRLGVFYRGRFFPAERAVDVTIEPAHDPVTVTIQQSYEKLPFKDFTDQFKEHPGQGFLHYGTNLQYKLVLTSDRPSKVCVRYGLKEHPESFQTKTLDITPRRRGEIIDVIHGNDFPIVKTSELLDIAPLTLQVTVFKEKENAEVLGRAQYPFRMIAPQQYIAVSANFDPGTRLLFVDVVHLANDPVTGPVEVYASIGGEERSTWIRRSRYVTFFKQVPPTMKKVTWRVGVESMPGAFREEVETPTPQVEEPAKAPAL